MKLYLLFFKCAFLQTANSNPSLKDEQTSLMLTGVMAAHANLMSFRLTTLMRGLAEAFLSTLALIE